MKKLLYWFTYSCSILGGLLALYLTFIALTVSLNVIVFAGIVAIFTIFECGMVKLTKSL